MNEWYKEDLAFIHDDGFRDFALKSAPGILEILGYTKRQLLKVNSSAWALKLKQPIVMVNTYCQKVM
ncbi:hypothetical protein ANSO36C_41120 [Nostoc cf. commune SO-36]|uniref:Uncharacterized protein n=1 Tax=Nostoc cf. commune SO-36 TaxID=449208 RepID=A0ABN6Q7P0_NOSCO|nr:hypothetical protein ANSO36C_41120 [Nostoc cf. commune SO-36]